jgi:PEP-CTERM motif
MSFYRIASSTLGAAAIAMAAPATAATTLNFDTGSCASLCTDGADVAQSYGDQAGVLDISYRWLTGTGNGATLLSSLQYWSSGYGDLTGVAYGGADSRSGASAEIKLQTIGNNSITLNSLDYAGYANTTGGAFRVYDLAYNLLFSNSLASSSASSGHTTLSFPVLTSTSGLILQYGDDWNVGVDNLTFTTAASAVPEASTWAMIIVGFGVVGAASRRRRPIAAHLA